MKGIAAACLSLVQAVLLPGKVHPYMHDTSHDVHRHVTLEHTASDG
jgi:hypothetical protein